MITKNFVIKYDDYMGDFDLKLTMDSGQTSQPPWMNVDGTYHEILSIQNEDVLVKISQKKLNADVDVSYCCDGDVDCQLVKDKLFYIFDLDYDITEVYDFLDENKELNDVYKFNKGLRLFKAQFPYECIISSICSANNSIKRWTKSITDIKKAYGDEILFNNRKYHLFPEEKIFLNIPDSDDGLKSFGVGYRSSYMLNSTKKIIDEVDFHNKINKCSYSEAFDKIIELDGVGPKVADCILLYGYNKHEAYPVDVWINRITSYIYFKGQKQTNKKIMGFAQDKFGEYSGYVQLYLFNYARLSGLTEKLKSKK